MKIIDWLQQCFGNRILFVSSGQDGWLRSRSLPGLVHQGMFHPLIDTHSFTRHGVEQSAGVAQLPGLHNIAEHSPLLNTHTTRIKCPAKFSSCAIVSQ